MTKSLNPTPTPRDLQRWCEGHARHFRCLEWLANVTREPPKIGAPKPDLDAMRALLIDLATHAPPQYFERAVAMVEAVSSTFITPIERSGLVAAIDWIRLARTKKAQTEKPLAEVAS